MQFHIQKALVAVATVVGCGVTTMAQAATVAYWRFEDGGFLADSSGNGHTLSNNGNLMTNPVLPTAGAGSDFFDPIPATGAANDRAAQRIESDTNYLSAADSDAFTSSTFTTELMVNVDTRDGNGFLAGQWGNNQSSHAIFMGSTGSLQLVLQNTGDSTTTFVNPNLSLALDTDYYVGVAYDLSAANAGDRTATFYLQDLTAGTPMQEVTVSNIGVSGVRNSPNRFAIGSAVGGGNGQYWSGMIDEVRLSDTALTSGELLVAVPEPSTALLAGSATLLLAARRRRA